jgi:hypothetical protein
MGEQVPEHRHSMGRLRYAHVQRAPHNHVGEYGRPVPRDTPDRQLRRISEQITEVQVKLMAKQKCLLQVHTCFHQICNDILIFAALFVELAQKGVVFAKHNYLIHNV